MPHVIETTVYQFEELTDQAKEAARSWYREWFFHDDWWYDCIFEDFQAICDILGVCLKTRSAALMGGGTRQQPLIYFRGFWSQGDGACFEAHYAYKPQSVQKIKDHAPVDTELHKVAQALSDIQRRNFYQLYADIRHRGRYCHAYSMDVGVERESTNYQSMTGDAEELVIEAMRDLANWLYRSLELQWDYLNSDEVVDASILANDYSFTASGEHFG